MKLYVSEDNLLNVNNTDAIIEQALQEEADRQRAIRQKYLERNKQRITEYHKSYYVNNRCRKMQSATDHYNANKDIKNESKICKVCERVYTQQNQKRHDQSKYHQSFSSKGLCPGQQVENEDDIVPKGAV